MLFRVSPLEPSLPLSDCLHLHPVDGSCSRGRSGDSSSCCCAHCDQLDEIFIEKGRVGKLFDLRDTVTQDHLGDNLSPWSHTCVVQTSTSSQVFRVLKVTFSSSGAIIHDTVTR